VRIVLKVGGNEIDDASYLNRVSELAVRIRHEHNGLVIVHGGGKEVTNLLAKLDVQTKFVQGLRYTDPQSMDTVEMMLSGLINKRLVKALQQDGVSAIGLSGVDGKILVAKKTTRGSEDIGLVGEVESVNASLLEELMVNFAVVLSPISVNEDSSSSLNVNADYAAAAVASSLKSELAIFLSNVTGVLKDEKPLRELHEKEFVNLRDSGVIAGGMIPKIEAALDAIRGGAEKTFITNADGASQLVLGYVAGTQVLL
jgi:acetylglutamate kinase